MDITYVIVRTNQYDEKNFTKPGYLLSVFIGRPYNCQRANEVRIDGTARKHV